MIMPMNIADKFHWLLAIFDTIERVLYFYDFMVSSHNHIIVEFVVNKFATMIPLYLSSTGFYGKRPNINYKNTKAYIEKGVTDPLDIRWLVGRYPSKKSGYGVYVAAFAEYGSIGELLISKEDLYDIDQHRIGNGALLWDYARKKQEIGTIS